MAGLSDAPFVQSLAVPAVSSLIAFLGYFSQCLFRMPSLDPGLPSKRETTLFNILLASLWYSYFKTVTEDPGRYVLITMDIKTTGNWCKICSAPKPPRAHHCRHCGRCIPKMDHHCPWTANCVSMTTFPHFLRFLVFANVSLWMLCYLLWQRCYSLWKARHLPAYLGPSLQALTGLAVTSFVCFFTLLALGIMLATTVKGFLFNYTMIESWQMERHEAILDSSGRNWWDLSGPNGETVTFERVEFPYDLGIFSNMSQAMGTKNFLLWLLPFSGGPKLSQNGKGLGWEWVENGFNRKQGMWPPPDPEKMHRKRRPWPATQRDLNAVLKVAMSPEEQKRAFKARQAQDAERKRLLQRSEENGNDDLSSDYSDHAEFGATDDWRNTDGDTLGDYGVDEDAEEYPTSSVPEDDMPLAELMRRRNVSRTNE